MERVRLFIKRLSDPSFNKIYMIGMILICMLILGGYFSYSMFTVSKERSNAISIVTGNLTYKLTVDNVESNKLVVGAKETKEFTVTLSNPNNRKARFNFYYEGSLASGVEVGYKTGEGINIPMGEKGANLTAGGSSGSSNIYKIRVKNESSSSVTITLGVGVGLDYNDLSLPSNGHLFEKYIGFPVAEIINYVESDQIFDDGVDTFIIGAVGYDPNNYIWYSGKLWRAVSVNNKTKTVKLVTQENITSINYDNDSNAFEGSYMEDWLNDTTVDGFLGNLREPDKFLIMDATWDATADERELEEIQRPNGTSVVADTVGLLNAYEYQSTSYLGDTYLDTGLNAFTLTPANEYQLRSIFSGDLSTTSCFETYGVRPSINLKSSVKIVGGNGTVDNPYRLNGDNDTNLSGTLLNTRYSGEYIRFGNDENNLYRIVSHETDGLTKITSAEPLKSSGTFITSAFGSSVTYSSTNTIGTFLNGEYLISYVDSGYSNMIEESSTWYLGTVEGKISYKLAKYKDSTGKELTENSAQAKVGLLRHGELMSGQINYYYNVDNVDYWLLTLYNPSSICVANNVGFESDSEPTATNAIKPALNLKSNVEITSCTVTKSDTFVLTLGS